MKRSVILGLDTGNFDVKTQHITFPYGYVEYENKPTLGSSAIFLNGKYYVFSNTRFPYVKNKIMDDKTFIVSLYGMAREILHKTGKLENVDLIKQKIEQIGSVNLGIGLPPGHMDKQMAPLMEYYQEKFKNLHEFTVIHENNEYNFNLALKSLYVFPQDIAAILAGSNTATAKETNTFIGIDIGGGTVDATPIENGKAEATKCISRDLGMLMLYDEIINQVMRKTGEELQISDIEDVLRDRNTIIDESIVSLCKEIANRWAIQILTKLNQAGVNYKFSYIVFVGGGSLLLKDYLIKSGMLKKYEFVEDPNANAKGYANYVKLILNQKKQATKK